MKTKFELETTDVETMVQSGEISIIGMSPINKPYVSIYIPGVKYHFLKDKDLELFAVNILKAIKSKKINHPTQTR